MSGPPTDISAKELYLKLTEPKPSEVFDWPTNGPDGNPKRKVRVMLLSMREHETARVEAHRAIKKKYALKEEDMAGVTMREVAGDAVARELIAMACVHVDPLPGTADSDSGPKYPRLFSGADHVSDLTAREVLFLFHAYLLVQEKYGPFEANGITNQDDLNKWIKRIEEGGSEFPLLSMTLPQLVTVAYSLQGRVTWLYRTLASQWSSLPDTLKSTLRDCCGDIESFGAEPRLPDDTGLSDEYDPLLDSGEELSIEDARLMAQRLRSSSV